MVLCFRPSVLVLTTPILIHWEATICPRVIDRLLWHVFGLVGTKVRNRLLSLRSLKRY